MSVHFRARPREEDFSIHPHLATGAAVKVACGRRPRRIFWSYEFFNLWSSPWWTAWIIIFYFAGAVLVDGFSRWSFRKYVCPIGQFNFIASLVSPMEVRVREVGVCSTCKTHDCLRGTAPSAGASSICSSRQNPGTWIARSASIA